MKNRYLEKIAGFPNLETVKSVLTKERHLPGHEAREAAELKQRTVDAHKFWRDHHDTNVREAMTRYHRTGESSHLQNAIHHADEAKRHDIILNKPGNLEKTSSTKTTDAEVGGATGVGGELLMRKYAPRMAAGLGHAGLAISGVVGAGVQMGIGAAQRHFQEKQAELTTELGAVYYRKPADMSKQAVEMPLKDLIKEHKDLVSVLKSNNRAGELKELKEQGAELSKLEKLANALQTNRQ